MDSAKRSSVNALVGELLTAIHDYATDAQLNHAKDAEQAKARKLADEAESIARSLAEVNRWFSLLS